MQNYLKYRGIMAPGEFKRIASEIMPPNGFTTAAVVERARRVLVEGLSAQAVANETGICKETIYRTIKKKFLPRFRPEDL